MLALLKEYWVPPALVAGTATLALTSLSGEPWTSIFLLVGLAAALATATRPAMVKAATSLAVGWLASVVLLLLALGPAALVVGVAGWSVLGLALFLQTVYLSAGCFFEKQADWIAAAITVFLAVGLMVLGAAWVGLRPEVAQGKVAPQWFDLALWWGVAVAVPVVALTLAARRRKRPSATIPDEANSRSSL